jgi:flagellar biosynthetic protein FliQ
MSTETVTDLCRDALMQVLLLSLPVLGVAILVGLITSIAQAVTQVQDQSLSLIPKIVLMLITLLYILPWGMSHMVDYSTTLYEEMRDPH